MFSKVIFYGSSFRSKFSKRISMFGSCVCSKKRSKLRSQQQKPNLEPLVLTLEIEYPHKANTNVK